MIARSSEITNVHKYQNETELAGPFKNVQIFMTNKLDGGRIRKWSKTMMHGLLRIMKLDELGGLPLCCIRMNSVKEGVELYPIFEYELPLNFHFEPELSSNFAAVRTHLKGEYIGFHFKDTKDRIAFSKALDSLQL